MSRRFAALMLTLSLAAASCGGGSSPPSPPSVVPTTTAALTDMGTTTYEGFQGGLYPNGSNSIPEPHNTAGLQRANAVQPRDTSGAPNANGKVVLLSIGMSNTTQEFCSQSSGLPCDPWTFMAQALSDPAVRHATLEMVNGAAGGRSAEFWDSPTDPDYDRIRDTRLAPRGLSEAQVQAAWVKVANPGPMVSLPSAQSDAFLLVMQMGNIVRALKARYPNLQMVFFSSRIYAGFATTPLNPEPYAYESGFAVKWVIEAQINQMNNGGVVVDPRAGDLNYNTGAPWLAWGPYLWANGANARSDGLTWVPSDFENDGTHPAQPGEQKVGAMLLNFFKGSPHTRCWFVVAGACP